MFEVLDEEELQVLLDGVEEDGLVVLEGLPELAQHLAPVADFLTGVLGDVGEEELLVEEI